MIVTLFKPVSSLHKTQTKSYSGKSLINSPAKMDSVSFGNTSALADELVNLAKQAKKIRLEELHPYHLNVFIEGNKYSVSKIPTAKDTSSIFRIKKDVGGKAENVSFVDVAEDLYLKTVSQLKEIAIPKILQRKGFEKTTVMGLIEELAQRIENKEIVYHDTSKKVQYGRVTSNTTFLFRNNPKNLAVNFAEVYVPRQPKIYKLELVDYNECKNSFVLQNEDDVDLAKKIFLSK